MTLSVTDVMVQDTGNYSCHARTRLDTATTNTAQIQIHHRTNLLKSPQDVSAVLDGPRSLSCQFQIDKRLIKDAEIYWTINNSPTPRDRTKTVPTGGDHQWKVLYEVDRVKQSDVGAYKCHVITSFDSSHSGPANLRLISGRKMCK